MPTYTWGCGVCQAQLAQFLPMREYVDSPPSFMCCGEPMTRVLGPVHLAVVSEASYNDLRASDGTDISSRAKHRDYMRRNQLTTIDDFALTWKRDERERRERLAGADPQRTQDIARAIQKLER